MAHIAAYHAPTGDDTDDAEDGQRQARVVTTPPSQRRRRLATAAALGGLALGVAAVAGALRRRPKATDGPAFPVSLAIDEASTTCAKAGESCLSSQCCQDATQRCYEKNKYWGTCRDECDPGLEPNDPDAEPWTCRVLGINRAWASSIEQAKKTLSNLTVEEKISLLRGENEGWPADRHGYAGFVGLGHVYGDPWMPHGVMPLTMNDGPQGYNSYGKFSGKSTQYPSLLTVAASFSTVTSRRYAKAISEEFVAKGANVLLGPDVEVMRVGLAGRSFETLSGEDPYLGSTLVPVFVKAAQDHGLIVCVKHFLDNNQEIYRQSMSAEVGERQQHEIYLPVFKAAFDAGANAVMCSYNKVHGKYACENSDILRRLLREELGFKGFVISDWGATHDALHSSKAGLDIDMQGDDPNVRLPDEYHKLPGLLKDGSISQASIDEKALHVLASMRMSGLFEGRFAVPQQWPKMTMGVQRGEQKTLVQADTTSDAHRQVAYQTIVDGAVLLKNEKGALPLKAGTKIVMVGKFCDQFKDFTIKQGDVYSGGGSGYVGTDSTITPFKGLQASGASVTLSVGADGAKGAEVAVVCAAAHSEEGWDRKDLVLPEAKELVSALRSQTPAQKIILVGSVPGAVTTEWVGDVDAALMLFEPGEQVGPAVADLLFGKASPGGRLPVSFPEVSEKRFTQEQYPGVCPPPKTWCPDMTANFSEGVLVGYRWNDAKDVPSAFPFGFGLTYTDFKLSNFTVTCSGGQAIVSLDVANVGGRDGEAVPQLYVGFDHLKPAVRQLRGFSKVLVPAGKKAKAAFQLGPADWSFYDEATKGWVSGLSLGDEVHLSVGTSSGDLVWHSKLPAKCSAATS